MWGAETRSCCSELQMWTQMLRQFTVFAALVLVVSAVPAVGEAQQEEPLRLVVVDDTTSDDAAGFEVLERMLVDSPQIELVDGDAFVDRIAEHGVSEAAIHPDRLEDHRDDLGAVMWHEEVESILIFDVDGPSRITVTAVGPTGGVVTDVTRSVGDGGLSDDAAMGVFEDLFSALVPPVQEFRQAVEGGELTDADFALPDSEAADDQLDLREQVAREHRKRYGDLRPHLDLRAGLMTGHRAMEMHQPEGDFSLAHDTVLMGPGVQVDSLLTTFDRHTAAVEVGGFFGMAPFVTVFGDEELSGQFFRFGAEVRYIGAVSATTRWRGIAGGETTNLSLDPNDQYTGHGYLNGRLGAGIHYTFEELASVQLDALFLPIVTASNSGGEYGDTDGWLGFGADATLQLEMFDPLLASVHYSFQYLDLNHPEPGDLNAPAASIDMIHQAMVTVGYRL